MTNDPKLIRSTWANVYPEHVSLVVRKYRPKTKPANCIAVLRRDFFDNGTCKVTIEEDV